MYYEAEEFFNLIKEDQTMSRINTYERSFITAKIMETARKDIGLIYPGVQKSG